MAVTTSIAINSGAYQSGTVVFNTNSPVILSCSSGWTTPNYGMVYCARSGTIFYGGTMKDDGSGEAITVFSGTGPWSFTLPHWYSKAFFHNTLLFQTAGPVERPIAVTVTYAPGSGGWGDGEFDIDSLQSVSGVISPQMRIANPVTKMVIAVESMYGSALTLQTAVGSNAPWMPVLRSDGTPFIISSVGCYPCGAIASLNVGSSTFMRLVASLSAPNIVRAYLGYN